VQVNTKFSHLIIIFSYGSPLGNCKGTLLDNTYTDNKKLHDFSVISIVNFLSHGNGQYLI
jgi:hypothetical protein